MPIIAQANGTDRDPIEQGTYLARCYSMIHLGTIDGQYEGKPNVRDMVRITFELPTELKVFKEEKGPQPLIISKEMSISLGQKSTMRPFLESWRGKKFTDQEIKGFDIEKLVGVPCMIGIGHKEKDGKTYEEIISISSPMKGVEVPPQINPSFIFTWDKYEEGCLEQFPQFIQDKMKSSRQYIHILNGGKGSVQDVSQKADDDLPF